MEVQSAESNHRGMQDFYLTREELAQRRSAKWSLYPGDVIPAFVAEMDFRVAPAVEAAIARAVAGSDFGYPAIGGQPGIDKAVATAFVSRMGRLFQWEPPENLVGVLSNLVQAIYATIMAYSEPGDGVIVQVPNYPPFREAIEQTGRRLITLPTIDDGSRHTFDLGALNREMDPTVKIFLLCNPHNPTGRVFTEAELRSIAEFAERHDLLVVSDEIHSELVLGGQKHIPFPMLSSEVASRTLLMNSATKSFNIPGLRCAVLLFGTEAMKSRFYERLPMRLLGSVNTLGAEATIAAWTQSDSWLSAVTRHLRTMRDRLARHLRERLPGIRFYEPEGTYLAWLDCSNLQLPGPAGKFFHDRAKIAFSAGEGFSPGAENFVRFNFATSPEILDEIVERMQQSLQFDRVHI